MVNAVQPEEVLAACVLSHVLGVQVTHTDVNGEADLAFLTNGDVSAAVEVTFLTDQQTKVSQDAWVRERERDFVVTQLHATWNVAVQGDSVRYNRLREKLEPHLAALEAAGITNYDQWGIAHKLSDTLPDAVRGLAALSVVQAYVLRTKNPTVQHIFISPMGGYTSRGSDAALADVEEYLLQREDNLRKLEESRASERHMFVWLDMDTPGAVARPFTGGGVAENFDHFGLPSRPPELPEPVTNLWVMHIGTALGWRWSAAAGWLALDLGAHFVEWRAAADFSGRGSNRV